ncbi:MAG: nuclear transport factor 2 family protein [Deltaproteobacteria bacterium]|nr:nuclear transport factor 2 family protein [Deltaproteobacteria bacterium]
MDSEARIEVLEKKLQQLEHELGIQKDIEEVRRLHYIYMHYNSNRMGKQLVDLVAENAESIEIAGRGVYYGKEGFRKNFIDGGGHAENEPTDVGWSFGNILFQLGGMEVITIADDRQSAKGRFAVLTPSIFGFPENQSVNLNAGVYEQEFVKEDGVWKIKKFKYCHYFMVRFDNLKVTPGYSRWPDEKNPADAPTTWYHPFPEAGVMPFHFVNPVTGEQAPELVDQRHYWIGNWPGEFGQKGIREHKPAGEKKEA